MRQRYINSWRRAWPAILAALVLQSASALQPPPRAMEPKKLAPYVTSPQPIVEKMLEIAKLKNGETLFDLGCGDGRILFSAARTFGAKAVGVELSPTLVRRVQQSAESQGLQDQVKVIEGDMMSVDVASANVVSLYLMTDANEQLRPKLEKELKPGSRVVSLEFKIKGWKPSKVEKVEVHRHPYTIYLYDLPQK
ncbi:methyltransferase domain-containing protein [uncultured Paludibaculum sp.]|uniref:methyltransferase domain-containing protein n=1 Tax=uncultured Paludibaculum sp. TaxID=1765020 RepID=UPI002AAAAA17|nr:methyltransferase domain-containing protein [uncultured Paludibaculum sp.]